jgi:hypothetical protein
MRLQVAEFDALIEARCDRRSRVLFQMQVFPIQERAQSTTAIVRTILCSVSLSDSTEVLERSNKAKLYNQKVLYDRIGYSTEYNITKNNDEEHATT